MSTSRYSDAGDNRGDYEGYLMEPFGPIGIICHTANIGFVQQVNRILHEKRMRRQRENSNPYVKSAGYLRDDYLIQSSIVRFETGEGKVTLNQTVRGHDILSYRMFCPIRHPFLFSAKNITQVPTIISETFCASLWPSAAKPAASTSLCRFFTRAVRICANHVNPWTAHRCCSSSISCWANRTT